MTFVLYFSNFISSKKQLGALNDTLFVENIKIVINGFSWGNKNYEIKSSHLPRIFW
jgi:hypothetical protein